MTVRHIPPVSVFLEDEYIGDAYTIVADHFGLWYGDEYGIKLKDDGDYIPVDGAGVETIPI
jgi:hypothetical protein